MCVAVLLALTLWVSSLTRGGPPRCLRRRPPMHLQLRAAAVPRPISPTPTFNNRHANQVFGEEIGVHPVVAAMIAVALLAGTGVLSWREDCLGATAAWDTLFWFGGGGRARRVLVEGGGPRFRHAKWGNLAAHWRVPAWGPPLKTPTPCARSLDAHPRHAPAPSTPPPQFSFP
jgi:hypothetical protein